MQKHRNVGFTLLELMIVLEITSVLAALAIPALLRQRIQTNEAAAVQNLRTLSSAQIAFNTVNLRYGTLEELSAGIGSTPYVDGTWNDGVVKNEYVYTLEAVTADTFRIAARPTAYGRSGIRTFSVDESGEIRRADEPAPGG